MAETAAALGGDPDHGLDSVDLMPVRYLSSQPIAEHPEGSPRERFQQADSSPDTPTTKSTLRRVDSMAPSAKRRMPSSTPAAAAEVEGLLSRMSHPINEADQESATASLCNLLADFFTHDLVVRRGGLPILFDMLRDSSLPNDTHYGVACTLHNLSCQAEILSDIVKAGGIKVLMDVLRQLPVHHHESLQSVVQVVRRLSFQDNPIKMQLVANGAVNAMVAIIRGEANDTTKANAAAAIQSLSFINDRLLDDYPAAVATLVDLLMASSNKQTQSCLIGALQNFSVHGSKFMGPSIGKFFTLLQTEHPTLIKCGALVLHNLSVEPEYKAILLHSNMVPVLVGTVRRSGSPIDTRLYALGCLHYIAQHEGARPRLLEEGAVACALEQLNPNVPALLREHALGLLENVAQCSELQQAMADAGCLEVVVKEIGTLHTTASEKYLATVALNYLCFQNVPNKLRVVQAGAIPAIMATLGSEGVADKLLESLLAALQSISVEESTSGLIIYHGGLPVLLKVLLAAAASPIAKEYASGTLQNIVFGKATMEQLVTLGGAEAIAALLNSPRATSTAKESVAVVVENVSLEDEFRDKLSTRDVIVGLLAALRNHFDALQEEVLGALQNLSMSVVARSLMLAHGAVEQLAGIAGESVPQSVKERAVFTLYHLCIDNVEALKVVAGSDTLPAIEAFATRYPHRAELRAQLLQFVADVKASTTLPSSGHTPSHLLMVRKPTLEEESLLAEGEPQPGTAPEDPLRVESQHLSPNSTARRPSAMYSTELVSPSKLTVSHRSKRDAVQDAEEGRPQDGTALRVELVQTMGDGGLEVAPLTPTLKSAQKVRFKKPQTPTRSGTTKSGSPRGKRKGSTDDSKPPDTSPVSGGSQPRTPNSKPRTPTSPNVPTGASFSHFPRTNTGSILSRKATHQHAPVEKGGNLRALQPVRPSSPNGAHVQWSPTQPSPSRQSPNSPAVKHLGAGSPQTRGLATRLASPQSGCSSSPNLRLAAKLSSPDQKATSPKVVNTPNRSAPSPTVPGKLSKMLTRNAN